MSSGSVTHWLGRLKAGDPAAAQPLWERYFPRLVTLARRRLAGLRGGAADEEDVALGAFDSFCRDAQQGRFPRLDDRDDLWRLLILLAGQKATDLIRRETADKRGGGGAADHDALERAVGSEPTPEFAAQVADEFRRLLGLLADPDLRALAVWKLEGYSTEEIADKWGCVPRTVERRLRVIRSLWAGEVAP